MSDVNGEQHLSAEELAQKYAGLLALAHAALDQELPGIKDKLADVEAVGLAALGVAKESRDASKDASAHSRINMVLLRELATRLGHKDILKHLPVTAGPMPTTEALPPMRPKAASISTINDSVDRIEQNVLDALREEAKKTSGPNVEAAPEQIAKMIRKAAEQEFKRSKDAADYKRLREDETKRTADAEASRLRFRKARTRIIVAAIIGIGALVGTYVKGQIVAKQEHEQGRTEGLAEAQRVVTVPLGFAATVSMSASAAPPAAPATAPAAATPRR